MRGGTDRMSVPGTMDGQPAPTRGANNEETTMRRIHGRMTTAFGALGALALLAAPAAARPVKVKLALAATGVDPNADGRTQLVLKNASDGKFDVMVRKVDRDTAFEVLVNGVKVGTLTTSGGGNGKASFRSRPRGHDQLLGFDPRGAVVTLRNADGQDVLTGTVPDDSVDPTAVVCCLPAGGDGEVECEDRGADACTQAGGTVSAATSCLPDPCGGATPPPVEVICCIAGSATGAFSQGHDDGGEVECEDRTQAACAAAGGTVVPATSCTPNPCTPTPPPADEIVCCVSHHSHSATECEVLTPATCTAREGTPSTAAACTPDACAASPSAAGGNDGAGHDAGDDRGGHHGTDDPSGHR
jgi:hypothetical protein